MNEIKELIRKITLRSFFTKSKPKVSEALIIVKENLNFAPFCRLPPNFYTDLPKKPLSSRVIMKIERWDGTDLMTVRM